MRNLSKTGSLFPLLAALAAFAVGHLPGAAEAHSYKMHNIMVGHVWAPPPKDGEDGIAVYGPLFNSGKKDVHLVGATCPIATKVRFRISKDGDVSWPKEIDLKPMKPVGMAAWREHIWLSGLKKEVHNGDHIKVVLDFGSEGKMPIEVLVEKKPGH